ncbi:MAG: hypothetical protein JJU28_01595 [Cyclobacteriaceae bacterium]|nr:hypothetical protein [Cyclobacteriaceae bacterium]
MKNTLSFISAIIFAGILSLSACSSEKKVEQSEEVTESTEVMSTAAEEAEIEEIEEETETDSTAVEVPQN